MQQGQRWLLHHAAVAVRSAGGDAFEQAQHRTNLGSGVERGDQVHLRRARIGKARPHSVARCVFEQPLSCLHLIVSGGRRHLKEG